jgi:response regulator NasT
MKILIADDESIIRMGLKSMLQEMGHVVFAARNGRDALQQARTYKPDLAVLDIRMPLTSGLDAAKAMYRVRPLPIILLTAYSDETLIDRATSLPIHAYLIKPVKTAELAAAIAVATKRFQDQQTETTRRQKAEDKLESRKTIDRAKGKLMAQGMSEEAAYNAIQQLARDTRQTMREAAEHILDFSES